MERTEKTIEVYQLRIWIRKISPQIWDRLLVRSGSTIAELHDALQIEFGWMDEHLNQFLIRGKPQYHLVKKNLSLEKLRLLLDKESCSGE